MWLLKIEGAHIKSNLDFYNFDFMGSQDCILTFDLIVRVGVTWPFCRLGFRFYMENVAPLIWVVETWDQYYFCFKIPITHSTLIYIQIS